MRRNESALLSKILLDVNEDFVTQEQDLARGLCIEQSKGDQTGDE